MQGWLRFRGCCLGDRYAVRGKKASNRKKKKKQIAEEPAAGINRIARRTPPWPAALAARISSAVLPPSCGYKANRPVAAAGMNAVRRLRCGGGLIPGRRRQLIPLSRMVLSCLPYILCGCPQPPEEISTSGRYSTLTSGGGHTRPAIHVAGRRRSCRRRHPWVSRAGAQSTLASSIWSRRSPLRRVVLGGNVKPGDPGRRFPSRGCAFGATPGPFRPSARSRIRD